MAIYNEILSPRYARMLQKLFGIKGTVPSKQLGGEIAPAFPIFNGRENRYLEAWSTFGGRLSQGAVAAQDTVARINNPAGSNIIAVIESIFLWSTTANVEVVIEDATVGNNGPLTTVISPANFDSRNLPPQTGSNGAACSISSANNIGQGNHVIAYDVITGGASVMTNELINFENQEIQLLPGADLQFRTLTLNVVLVVNIRWRERFLEESERA